MRLNVPPLSDHRVKIAALYSTPLLSVRVGGSRLTEIMSK